MKYHLSLRSGKWIGGFMVSKAHLADHLDDLRDVASTWKAPLVATRLDGKRRGDRIDILPREADQ
jgi:hypothetical protein